jgi:hypothetical protein
MGWGHQHPNLESTYSILQYTDVLNSLSIHFMYINYSHKLLSHILPHCKYKHAKRLSNKPTGNTAEFWLIRRPLFLCHCHIHTYV